MKTLLIACACLAVGCGSNSPKTSATIDPSKIERKPSPTGPIIEPPEVKEPDTDPEHGARLRMKFEQGEKVNRQIVGTVTLEADSHSSSKPSSDKTELRVYFLSTVESVKDGLATIRIKSTPFTASGEADIGSRSQPEDFVVKVDERGRIVENFEGLVKSIVCVAFVPFPERRVLPGSQWSVASSIAAQPIGDIDVEQKFIFRGETKVDGNDVYKVDTVATAGDKLNITGTYYFLKSNCQLYKGSYTAKAKASLPNQDGTEVPSTMTLTAAVSRASN